MKKAIPNLFKFHSLHSTKKTAAKVNVVITIIIFTVFNFVFTKI